MMWQGGEAQAPEEAACYARVLASALDAPHAAAALALLPQIEAQVSPPPPTLVLGPPCLRVCVWLRVRAHLSLCTCGVCGERPGVARPVTRALSIDVINHQH